MQFKEDLHLAQACASGDSPAWQRFLDRYSAKLQSAAYSLVHDQLLARELADTLCADLFIETKSRLATYSGWGSLENWLKVLLYRLYIDRYRSQRRYVSFDDQIRAIDLGFDPNVLNDRNFESCLKRAIGELAPERRFLLASHFFDRRTLAQIAAMLHIHESTASRRLDKALRQIRLAVLRQLRAQGLDRPTVTDVSFDIHAELLSGVDIVEDPS